MEYIILYDVGEIVVKLSEGIIGNEYVVQDISLPMNLTKRLEALGMTKGTLIQIVNGKCHGILIIKLRGTCFALGKNITQNIIVG